MIAVWLAQAAATCVWLAAWLVLGALGLVTAPSLAMAFVPLAAWLLGVGLLRRWSSRRVIGSLALTGAIAVSAIATAAAMWGSQHGASFGALLVAAPAWSVLAVTVARGVRLLERTDGVAPPAAPVLAAAAATWVLFHALDDPRRVMLTGVVLLLIVAGGFAFLLLWATPQARRDDASLRATSRPIAAARFVMLPMMATLAWEAQACRATGIAPGALLALHLAAMFVPAALLQHMRRPPLSQMQLRAAVVSLMAAGALSAAWTPQDMLHWAAALQGAAWSLAGLLRARSDSTRRPAALDALLVILLGIAIARHGAAALAIVHTSLGAWALSAFAADRLLRRRGARFLSTTAFTCQVKQSFD